MRICLLFILYCICHSICFCQTIEDISKSNIIVNEVKSDISLPVIEIPIIAINDIDINKTFSNDYYYYLTTYNPYILGFSFNINNYNISTYNFNVNNYYLTEYSFNTLGLNFNTNNYYLTDYKPKILGIHTQYINVSKEWDIFYNQKIYPLFEYYTAKIDLLGENGEYYPDGMTYYGWRWIELQQKEKDEGFTESVRQEWIKLFKEMKPYF